MNPAQSVHPAAPGFIGHMTSLLLAEVQRLTLMDSDEKIVRPATGIFSGRS